MPIFTKQFDAVAGFLVTKKCVFLAVKKEKVGKGFFMPYGGIIERGENPQEAMVRELKEESGADCDVTDLEKVGYLVVSNYGGKKRTILNVHFYFIHSWTGVPRETSEMNIPQKFLRAKRHLPMDRMLPADQIIVPQLLDGRYISAQVSYDLNAKAKPAMLSYEVTVIVNRFPWK